MNDLQRIPISASEAYPGVVRKIAIVGKNEDYEQRTVTLICKIEHTDADGRRLNAFATLERDPFLLVASDSSLVHPQTGALVFPDESGNFPKGSIGQYTWLKAAVENGVNPFDITAGAVLEADTLKRFT